MLTYRRSEIMKRILVFVTTLVVLGAVLGTAYALGEPLSTTQVIHSIDSIPRYSFRRTVTFNQYHVYVAEKNGTRQVERTFAYAGKVVATGRVDLDKGIVTENEEFYVNDSVVMKGQVVVNLRTNEISGSIKLPNGSDVDVLTFWKEYFGLSKDQALAMFRENLPLVSLRGILESSESITMVQERTSASERLLQGLGIKEKVFEYRFTTKSGKEWHVFVDSRGRPHRFEMKTDDASVVIDITPEE
jgi:hypothetical protein